MINREGYFVSEAERQCTNCGAMFTKTSKTVTLCNSCNSSRVKGQSVEQKMLQRAKQRSRDKGAFCNLDLSDIVVPSHCPILGIEIKSHSGRSGGNPNSPALDRINNSLGYTKGNVWVISHLANMMKSSANTGQLVKFAEWVIAEHGNSA